MSSGNRYVRSPEDYRFIFSKDWSGDGNAPSDRVSENGYTMNLTEYTSSGYSNTGLNGWPGSPYSWGGFSTVRRKILLSSNDQLSLIGKLQEAVQDHSFNAAISAAELPEALGAVVRSAKNVYDAYRDVRRGHFGDAARSLSRVVSGGDNSKKRRNGRVGPNRPNASASDIAETWLSLKWGWLPLLNDVYEGLQAYAKNRNPQRTYRTRVKKSVKYPIEISGSGESLFWASGIGSCEYRVTYKEMALSDELGLTDPMSVIWEKIPFSCVLDWFIPVGDYFSARAFINALTYSASSTEWSRVDGVRGSEPCNTGKRMAYQFPHDTDCSGIDTPKPVKQLTHVHSLTKTWRKDLWLRRTASIALTAPKPGLKALEKAFSTDHMATLGALFTAFASGGDASDFGSKLPRSSRGMRDFFK